MGMSQVVDNAAGFLRSGMKGVGPEKNLLLSQTFDEMNIMKRTNIDLARKNRTPDTKDRSYRVKLIKSFADINQAYFDRSPVKNGDFFNSHCGRHKKGSKSLNFPGPGPEVSRQSS